jgi:hypothetical protein
MTDFSAAATEQEVARFSAGSADVIVNRLAGELGDPGLSPPDRLDRRSLEEFRKNRQFSAATR